jgi:hypothetical protein
MFSMNGMHKKRETAYPVHDSIQRLLRSKSTLRNKKYEAVSTAAASAIATIFIMSQCYRAPAQSDNPARVCE